MNNQLSESQNKGLELMDRIEALEGNKQWSHVLSECYAVIDETDPNYLREHGLWISPEHAEDALAEHYTAKQMPFVLRDLCHDLKTAAGYLVVLQYDPYPDLADRRSHFPATLASYTRFAQEVLHGTRKYPDEPKDVPIQVFTGEPEQVDALVKDLHHNVEVWQAMQHATPGDEGSVN